MGGWGCPHQVNQFCQRLTRECDPGIPGCILYGLIERKDVAPPPMRRLRKETTAKSPDPAPHDEED